MWLIASLFVVGMSTSCTENDKEADKDPDTESPGGDLDGENPGGSDGLDIVISDVVANYNSVTFTVKAKDALAIAYTVLSQNSEISAQEVFEVGEAKGGEGGTYTYKGLSSESKYTLYVAAKSSKGNHGPKGYDFETEVNTGAASSTEAAGIRVDKVGTTSLIWEVANGDDVDFSLTMVQPTIIMENDIYEYSKEGVTAEEYITSFMTAEGNGYLVRETKGAGATAMYNYEEIYSLYPMFANGRYTIYTLGCKGDYADLTSITPLEITELEVTTEAIARTGNPYVKVDLVNRDYIGLRHHLTPNADTKYWAKFFTQTSEMEEFEALYDRLEGDGAGRRRIKEYIQQADPYILEQSGETDIPMSLGWGFEGVRFSRLALGFDANLVAGDEYSESIATVREVGDTPPGEYTMKIDSIGAGNFYLTTTLAPNCYRVFWRTIPKGAFDDILADDEQAMILAQALDREGNCEFRSRENGTEDIETNANHDVEYIRHSFIFDEAPDSDIQIVATSLNYDGVLSRPMIIADIHTLPRTLGDFEPALTISAESISKTNILIKYSVHDDAYETDQRLFFHRFLDTADPIFDSNPSDDELREWLIATEGGIFNANLWTLVSTDSEDEDEYNYFFNWAGMTPGTEYKYFYCTENGKGEISKLKYVDTTTINNDGGANPEFTIDIKAEDIVSTEGGKYGAKGFITPHEDVVTYKYLFFGQKALESYRFDVNDPEELTEGLYILLESQGLQDIEPTACSSYAFAPSEKVWLAVQGQGANGVQSKLSYVGFNSDGVIDEQVDADITAYMSAPQKSFTSYMTLPYTSVEHRVNNDRSQLTPSVLKTPAQSDRKITNEEAAELRRNGVPYYSLRELNKKIL